MSEFSFVKQSISDKDNSNKYLFKAGNKELGYAYIFHNKSINNVYFFINPQFRSNGYGFLLFKNVIKELKNTTNYSHINLDIEQSNPHANNIIGKCGGLILSKDSQTHWLLKL